MRARTIALVLTAALVVYFVLLFQRAWALLGSGQLVQILLGVGVLLLPFLGAWTVWTTWVFGIRVQRLTTRLDEEGGFPDVEDLPRRPSGRIDRAAADSWFAARKAELEADPEDWRNWFRLAYAYDLAGDRRRARETMRRAVDLEAS